MPTFRFADAPAVHHQVQFRTDAIRVDGTDLRVRTVSPGCFVSAIDGRNERLYAVAHGDAIYVQLKGRAWKVERVDLTRSAGGNASSGAGTSHAPMPGVVVSILIASGQQVRQGDALLIIESMKLQMTIAAHVDGEVTELPLSVGQTFQRGDVLVRIVAAEVAT